MRVLRICLIKSKIYHTNPCSL